MYIKTQFLAGILFATSVFSWVKLFYWHFDKNIMGYMLPGIVCLLIALVLVITDYC